MKEHTKYLVLATLVADSFTLGAHWVYSPQDIAKANLDWTGLNKPISQWHNEKEKGDFTHYGDQIICLYEYIKKNRKFNLTNYIDIWKQYMDIYPGYIDSASKQSIKNLEDNNPLPSGSTSNDFSVIGRIAPLLLVSATQKNFLNNVKLFVSATHNNEEVLESADFFASLLWKVRAGKTIMNSIELLTSNYSKRLQEYVRQGLESSDDTTKTIIELGSACSTNGAFQSTIYLLNSFHDNFEKGMIENAKAGGDSSARAMLFTMLMVMQYGKDIIPNNWFEQMKYKI